MSFKELLIKEYEDRSVELEKQIDEYNLLLEKKKSESNNIDNEINTKSSEIENKKVEINKFENDITKLKMELTDLSNPSEALYVIAFPDNSVSIVKECDLQEVNNIELKEFNKLIDGIERNKAVAKLTKDEYKDLLKKEDFSNRPLDKKYYKDQKSGNGFCQWHLRGLEPEDVKKWEDGKLSFPKLIEGHSLHEDIRLTLPSLSKMVQYVVVESDIESYIRMMNGELNPEQKGAKNVQKAKIVSKPSGEPPKIKIKEAKDMLIDEKGAKLIDKYIIRKQSYIISAGQVGATKDKDAYMGLVWTGKVSEGVQRHDFHEYFFYPDNDLPDLNKKMMDGKFVIRCFKGNERSTSWMMWKATKNPLPLNSFCYIDEGFHYLVPADKVKNFGHENYKEWKTREKDC